MSLIVLHCIANSIGGSLIFGISDKGDFTIKGLDYDKEFSRRFGDKLRAEPPIRYESPIFIEIPGTNKYIIVIRIPQSENKPHVHRDLNKMKFWKRTNKGKDLMTLEEIRDVFQKPLKEKINVLDKFVEFSIISENERRKNFKDYYTHRIFSHYNNLLNSLGDLDTSIEKYLTNKTEKNEYILKATAKDFIKDLDVFVAVAIGDINEIKPILDSPMLRDKFDDMINQSRNIIKGVILKGDDVNIYSLITPLTREKTIQVWMDAITKQVNLVRKELQPRQ